MVLLPKIRKLLGDLSRKSKLLANLRIGKLSSAVKPSPFYYIYCDDRFGRVVPVDPKYTSQRCNQCGHVDKDNRKTQRRFKCMACGHQI